MSVSRPGFFNGEKGERVIVVEKSSLGLPRDDTDVPELQHKITESTLGVDNYSLARERNLSPSLSLLSHGVRCPKLFDHNPDQGDHLGHRKRRHMHFGVLATKMSTARLQQVPPSNSNPPAAGYR